MNDRSRRKGRFSSGLVARIHEESHVLDPVDRLVELIYGVLLVLTFTGAVRVGAHGHAQVQSMIAAAIGCSLAWGVVDGVMFVFGRLLTRDRDLVFLRSMRDAASDEDVKAVLGNLVPDPVLQVLAPGQVEELQRTVRQAPLPGHTQVTWSDLRAGVAIFLLANLALVPLTAPFLLIHDLALASNLSNALAIAILFGAGWFVGHRVGQSPVRSGLGLAVFGVLLAGVTLALGG